MTDSVLVTGGTGKTGRRVADLLRGRGIAARVGTRSPVSSDQVRFDWTDAGSFVDAILDVRAVYMVAPTGAADPLDAMRPFIDKAIGAGVARVVLLSSSMLEEGGPLMGAVYAYLKAEAPGWTALRPSWFMQNFSEQQHLDTILAEGRIYSATEDGRVPFIDAGDIAAVAVEALLDDDFGNGDLILTGPETLSYDEVAKMISVSSGRPVAHNRLGLEELTSRFEAIGIPGAFAQALAGMDGAIAHGAEDRVTDTVEAVTGRRPKTFAEFVRENGSRWTV
mgnify:CR=1 FL=1